MKKIVTGIFIMLTSGIYAQNEILLQDKLWEIQEYYTETPNETSIYFDRMESEHINDLTNSGFRFLADGSYQAVVEEQVNTTGVWSFSSAMDSLDLDTNTYKINMLTDNSLILKTSDKKFGLDIASFLVMTKKEEQTLSSSNGFDSRKLIKLYPIPAKDKLQLTFSEKNSLLDRAIIFTLDGRAIRETPIEQQQQEIVIKDLAKGVYLLEIVHKDDKVFSVKKFIKD